MVDRMIYRTGNADDKPRGHSHLVYLPVNEAGQFLRPEAVTGEDSGHTHLVELEETTGTWVVMPAEEGGHTHLIGEPVVGSPDKDDRSEQEKVREVRALFKASKELEGEAYEDAVESEEFYHGEQWSDKARRSLNSQDRACLTINLIKPSIQALCGFQRQNRTDFKFYPVEDGDARVADMCTALVKNICDQNDYDAVETRVFEDAVIAGRGAFHVYVDYGENIEGDIKIEQWSWREVHPGPHERLDWSDCEYVCRDKWYSLERLKRMYPEKADDLVAEHSFFAPDGKPIYNDPVDAYDDKKDGILYLPADPEYVDLTKKEYRLLVCEKRQYRQLQVLVHALDGFVVPAVDWSPSDVSRAKALDGFQAIPRERVTRKVYIVSGSCLLDEYESDSVEFDLLPLYAERIGSRFYGKVQSGKDPQREINKRRSQAVDIGNKMSSWTKYYDQKTFKNPADARRYKQEANKIGGVFELNDITRMPQSEEGVRMPTEVVSLEQSAIDSLYRVLNVNKELLGQESEVKSNVALLTKQKMSLQGNEYLFDNLALTKRAIGRKLVHLIGQIYTPERIMRVLGNRAQKLPVEVAGQPFAQQNPAELLALLRKADITKFDLVVGESAQSPSVQLANFAMLLEMAQAGLPVPPDMMIQNSPMPQELKDQMLQSMQQQQQAAAQAEQEKNQTELIKSMPDEIKMAQAVAGGGAQGEGIPM